MQVMYEAVLRALGSTGHRQHFQALARAVSWDDLQRCLDSIPPPDRGLAAEALLLGIAGMLPSTRCHVWKNGCGNQAVRHGSAKILAHVSC